MQAIKTWYDNSSKIGKKGSYFLENGGQDIIAGGATLIGGIYAANSGQLKNVEQGIKSGSSIVKGASGAKFGDKVKLESHFGKHGNEFKGAYSNVDEYLQGARDVMKNGTKVEYTYKGEVRRTYYEKYSKSFRG